jgi:hypothetical protein
MSTPTPIHSGKLCLGPLTAEYTIGQARLSGRWVAIATIAEEEPDDLLPDRLVIGMGDSRQEAIADLRRKIEGILALQAHAVADPLPQFT